MVSVSSNLGLVLATHYHRFRVLALQSELAHYVQWQFFSAKKKKCAGRPLPPTTFRVYWCIHRTSILEVWRLPVQLLEL